MAENSPPRDGAMPADPEIDIDDDGLIFEDLSLLQSLYRTLRQPTSFLATTIGS